MDRVALRESSRRWRRRSNDSPRMAVVCGSQRRGRGAAGFSSFGSASAASRRRVTFCVAEDRRVVLLTTFRKLRQNKRAEGRRARQAMRWCLAKGHTPEEE